MRDQFRSHRISSIIMQGHCCCQRTTTKTPGRLLRFTAWILPSMVLAVMPKCPLCVIAAISLITGVGVSVNTGRFLRTSAITVCVALLAFVIVNEVRRCIHRFRKPLHRVVETET